MNNFKRQMIRHKNKIVVSFIMFLMRHLIPRGLGSSLRIFKIDMFRLEPKPVDNSGLELWFIDQSTNTVIFIFAFNDVQHIETFITDLTHSLEQIRISPRYLA